MSIRRVLLIPKITIQNANALSSPYTIGFPAMTAWLGAVHALERKLKAYSNDYSSLRFNSMAVVCHQLDLQTYKGKNDYVHSLISTGNPLVPKSEKDKPNNAVRPPFIEEARCHLTVSLVMEYEGIDMDDIDDFLPAVKNILYANMKMASGDVLNVEEPTVTKILDETGLKRLMRKLMPGYCLIERRDLMQQAMAAGQDAIDALLDSLQVFHRCEQEDEGKITWSSHRQHAGWIVPIAIGFQGITSLGKAKHQRDTDTPHRFAESMVTLGEFVMPYRIETLDQMLWHYHTDLTNNLYLCQQKI